MPYRQVKDVIDRIQSFHRQLERYYHAVSEKEGDSRLALLLEHMARHEESLDACLGRFDHQERIGIRETWLQYVPDHNVARVIQETEIHAGMSADDVIRAALEMDHVLIELYRGLATSLVAPSVRELFASMAEMEKRKGMQNSRALDQLKD